MLAFVVADYDFVAWHHLCTRVFVVIVAKQQCDFTGVFLLVYLCVQLFCSLRWGMSVCYMFIWNNEMLHTLRFWSIHIDLMPADVLFNISHLTLNYD